jgi:hypothetical protein
VLRDHTIGAALVAVTVLLLLLRDLSVEGVVGGRVLRRVVTAAAMTGVFLVVALVAARFLVVR